MNRAELPELQTERLTIRHAQAGMEAAMVTFLKENREHLAPWSPPAPRDVLSESFWGERLRVAAEAFRAGRTVAWVMQARGAAPSDAILGTATYSNIVRGPFQACNLGYQIARAHEGQGLMGEALRATNAYMFEAWRLHRIMANYRPENARSARVLERLGFAPEGLAKDYLFIDGAWRDHVLTALVNPAFERSWLE